MTTYYVDPTATAGNDDGSSEANAWTTLQRAIDGSDGTQPAAGDTVKMRHSGAAGVADESPAATIDFDGNPGGGATGTVKWQGVNSSWVNDGTRYVVDWGTNAVHGLKMHDTFCEYTELENIELMTSASGTYYGITRNTGYIDQLVFANCSIHGWYTGVSGSAYFRYGNFRRCLFYDLTADGIDRYSAGVWLSYCVFHGIGSRGVDLNGSAMLVGCLFYDCATAIYNYNTNGRIHNCVIDDCTTGLYNAYGNVHVSASRFTNNTTGISTLQTNGMSTIRDCYLGGNTTDINGTYYRAMNNTLNGSDTNHGYLDPTNRIYGLRDDATLRSAAIELP